MADKATAKRKEIPKTVILDLLVILQRYEKAVTT